MTPDASGLGIVAALTAEASLLGPAEPLEAGLAALPDGTLLAVSGIGCTAAAQSARALAAAGCRALASWGLAGGLDPSLSAGAILLPDEVMLETGASLQTAVAWRTQIERALAALGPPVLGPLARGKLLTSGRTLGAVADKAMAFRDTQAVAVDMESFAVGEEAMRQGLPFIAVRVIIDTAADEVPAALARMVDSEGRLSVGRVLRGAASEPRALASLLRLARRYRVARRALRGIARSGALAVPGRGS